MARLASQTRTTPLAVVSKNRSSWLHESEVTTDSWLVGSGRGSVPGLEDNGSLLSETVLSVSARASCLPEWLIANRDTAQLGPASPSLANTKSAGGSQSRGYAVRAGGVDLASFLAAAAFFAAVVFAVTG